MKTLENASFRGQGSRILPWKDPGLEDLAPKGARVRRFCFERGQGSRIWLQKLLELEDLALKGGRVRGFGAEKNEGSRIWPCKLLEMAPGSLFGALRAHFLVWARKLLQEACLELSGLIFWPGPVSARGSQKILQNC